MLWKCGKVVAFQMQVPYVYLLGRTWLEDICGKRHQPVVTKVQGVDGHEFLVQKIDEEALRQICQMVSAQ